jgi:ankyrin repeat protein
VGLEACDDKRGDALQLGYINGHMAVVDKLLRVGANPNKVNEHGWTSLCASHFQQKAILNRLVLAEEDVCLFSQVVTLTLTLWSQTDKSAHLELGENRMSVRYISELLRTL